MSITAIRCLGCECVLRANSSICPNCMRCPGCGGRRLASDPPCECGHPHDENKLADLLRRRAVSDPNVDAALVVAEAAGSASISPAKLEAAWSEWLADIQKVDEPGMTLLRAAFEAGCAAGRKE